MERCKNNFHWLVIRFMGKIRERKKIKIILENIK
jgi:hypothetical protein